MSRRKEGGMSETVTPSPEYAPGEWSGYRAPPESLPIPEEALVNEGTLLDPEQPEPDPEPEPDPQPDLGAEWNDMSEAPINRAIFITADPTDDPSGVLSYWRTTREKISGRKGWHTKSYWAAVLTKRALDFEPYCWREAVPGIALEAAKAA